MGRKPETYDADYSEVLVGATVPGDPDWNGVELLLPLDTDFTDISTNTHTVTAYGNAAISTAQIKFGAGSVALDGSGDYLSIPSDSSFVFELGDFTVEMWCYPTNNYNYGSILDHRGSNAGSGDWMIGVDGSHQLYVHSVGTNVVTSGATLLTENAWHHIAYTRASGTHYLFIDGVLVGEGTAVRDYQQNSNTYVGSFNNGASEFFYGYIDDLRITKGVARYTADFTAPTEAFLGSAGSEDSTQVTGSHIAQDVTLVASTVLDATLQSTDAGKIGYPTGNTEWMHLNMVNATGSAQDFTVWTYNYTFGRWTELQIPMNFAPAGGGGGGSSSLCPEFETEPVPGPSDDPHWDNVVLLVPMDAAVSGVPIDLSDSSHTITNVGSNWTIDSAEKKFGAASGDFTAAGAILELPQSSDFAMGTGNFTIEGWFYSDLVASRAATPARTNDGVFQIGLTDYWTTGYNKMISLGIFEYSLGGNRGIHIANGSGTVFFEAYGGQSGNTVHLWEYDTWHHFAMVRTGDGVSANMKTRVYIDGAAVSWNLMAGGSAPNSVDAPDPQDYTGQYLGLGRRNDVATNQELRGYIDDFRMTKGIARYTANFTPPTAAFPGAGVPSLWDAASYGTTEPSSSTVGANFVRSETTLTRSDYTRLTSAGVSMNFTDGNIHSYPTSYTLQPNGKGVFLTTYADSSPVNSSIIQKCVIYGKLATAVQYTRVDGTVVDVAAGEPYKSVTIFPTRAQASAGGKTLNYSGHNLYNPYFVSINPAAETMPTGNNPFAAPPVGASSSYTANYDFQFKEDRIGDAILWAEIYAVAWYDTATGETIPEPIPANLNYARLHGVYTDTYTPTGTVPTATPHTMIWQDTNGQGDLQSGTIGLRRSSNVTDIGALYGQTLSDPKGTMFDGPVTIGGDGSITFSGDTSSNNGGGTYKWSRSVTSAGSEVDTNFLVFGTDVNDDLQMEIFLIPAGTQAAGAGLGPWSLTSTKTWKTIEGIASGLLPHGQEITISGTFPTTTESLTRALVIGAGPYNGNAFTDNWEAQGLPSGHGVAVSWYNLGWGTPNITDINYQVTIYGKLSTAAGYTVTMGNETWQAGDPFKSVTIFPSYNQFTANSMSAKYKYSHYGPYYPSDNVYAAALPTVDGSNNFTGGYTFQAAGAVATGNVIKWDAIYAISLTDAATGEAILLPHYNEPLILFMDISDGQTSGALPVSAANTSVNRMAYIGYYNFNGPRDSIGLRPYLSNGTTPLANADGTVFDGPVTVGGDGLLTFSGDCSDNNDGGTYKWSRAFPRPPGNNTGNIDPAYAVNTDFLVFGTDANDDLQMEIVTIPAGDQTPNFTTWTHTSAKTWKTIDGIASGLLPRDQEITIAPVAPLTTGYFGCTDLTKNNYEPWADTDDGSCGATGSPPNYTWDTDEHIRLIRNNFATDTNMHRVYECYKAKVDSLAWGDGNTGGSAVYPWELPAKWEFQNDCFDTTDVPAWTAGAYSDGSMVMHPMVLNPDPHWDKVELLLPMDAAVSGVPIDLSSSPKTITNPGGSWAVSTAEKKYGTASGNFAHPTVDTEEAVLRTTIAAFGTEDFTIEGWFNVGASAPSSYGDGIFQLTTAAGLDPTHVNTISFGVWHNGTGARDTTLSINDTYVYTNVAPHGSMPSGSTVNIWSQSTWHHFAVVRTGGGVTASMITKVYIDGVAYTSLADVRNYTCTHLSIGARAAAARDWHGHLDDFRVTKGVARYTANFTKPSKAHPVPVDSNDMLWYNNVPSATDLLRSTIADDVDIPNASDQWNSHAGHRLGRITGVEHSLATYGHSAGNIPGYRVMPHIYLSYGGLVDGINPDGPFPFGIEMQIYGRRSYDSSGNMVAWNDLASVVETKGAYATHYIPPQNQSSFSGGVAGNRSLGQWDEIYGIRLRKVTSLSPYVVSTEPAHFHDRTYTWTYSQWDKMQIAQGQNVVVHSNNEQQYGTQNSIYGDTQVGDYTVSAIIGSGSWGLASGIPFAEFRTNSDPAGGGNSPGSPSIGYYIEHIGMELDFTASPLVVTNPTGTLTFSATAGTNPPSGISNDSGASANRDCEILVWGLDNASPPVEQMEIIALTGATEVSSTKKWTRIDGIATGMMVSSSTLTLGGLNFANSTDEPGATLEWWNIGPCPCRGIGSNFGTSLMDVYSGTASDYDIGDYVWKVHDVASPPVYVMCWRAKQNVTNNSYHPWTHPDYWEEIDCCPTATANSLAWDSTTTYKFNDGFAYALVSSNNKYWIPNFSNNSGEPAVGVAPASPAWTEITPKSSGGGAATTAGAAYVPAKYEVGANNEKSFIVPVHGADRVAFVGTPPANLKVAFNVTKK